MTTPVFREVASPSDWESAVQIRNELLWQRPISVEEVLDWLERKPSDAYHARTLMSVQGQDVGTFTLLSAYWLDAPGRIEIHAHSRDASLFPALFSEAVKRGTEAGATKLGFWARTDRPEQLSTAITVGFAETQRNPEAGLDVAGFQTTEHWPIVEKLTREGTEFLSYSEYAQKSPDTWLQDVWRLENEILADVPFPEPHKADSLEEFEKYIESPFLDKSAMFLALTGGQLAGMSQLMPSRVDPKIAATGLTGVRREHRRRGLALALKTVALDWARRRGIEWVFTDNEENNPMYGLNLKLGFAKQFEWVCFEMACEQVTS